MYSPENELMEQAQRRVSSEKRTRRGRMDLVFFIMVLVLLTTGLIMLASASYAFAYYNYGNSYLFILNQAKYAVIGVVAMVGISYIDFNFYAKYKIPWILFFFSLALLAVVLILPPMSEGFDYKRWIKIGSFTFQPSEIAKFAVILIISYLASKFGVKKMSTFKYGILPFLGILAVTCGLVVVEPHLSATILILLISIVLLIVGGIKLRWLVLAGGGTVVIGAVAILSGVVGYGSDRIKYWIDPWADATGKGYQTIQSLLAIGSGGFWGRGLGMSRQKYLWVPEPQNDFIFSIVCEELGFVGALCIVAAFGVLIWRGVLIAIRCPNRFGSMLVIGIVFQVGLQMLLNILVVTNTIPNTGISLPFFSYGGTALLMIMGEMGIVLSVSRCSGVSKS